MNFQYIQTPAPPRNTGQEVQNVSSHSISSFQHPPYQLSSARPYADLPYLFGVQDPAMIPTKTARNRRKSTQGSEGVKHRRTRSGCYTCRSRRVKCDETHPVCERCKKGGRECLYPEPATSSKTGTSAIKTDPVPSQGSPGSSTDDYDDVEDLDQLETILDADESMDETRVPEKTIKSVSRQAGLGHPLQHQKSFTRHSSETPSLVQDKGLSPSPSTEGSIGHPIYSNVAGPRPNSQTKRAPPGPNGMLNDWSHLPPDLQFFLTYFYQTLTYHHYSIKHDSCDFLRTHFLDAALRNDALLHAVVGFSAFQYTLHHPGGQINDFLQYYNKAVSLLLKSLKQGGQHSMGILLAILQLATIEEYLGDWINLMGHQKAAYEILTELYNPETIMQTECTRVILGWYSRFDVFAGLMGGFETVLSRDWFSGSREWFERRATEEPDNINWKIEEAISSIRLVAMDMSMLFAKKGKGEISNNQFLAENNVVGQRIADWKENMDPSLEDSRWRVTDFTGSPPVDPEDIVNPYIPGTMLHGPLWSMNKCMIDWYSVDLMHKYQTALTLQSQPSKELAMKAFATCQLFEAIEYWPQSPQGSILSCQASLGIASLFLPRDRVHGMWCRRKLAVIESHGYIYPLTFRTKMAALFQDPSCMHWWLPNNDSYPPIIRSIRRFVEERTSEARNVPAEDLRDIKGIFASMNLDDGKSSMMPVMRKGKAPQDLLTISDEGWSAQGMSEEAFRNSGGLGSGEGHFGAEYDEEHGAWTGGASGTDFFDSKT